MKKFISQSFLIIGNTIGSGILALPLVTAAFGFYPSVAILIFSWLVMNYTSKVLLEACYWVQGEEHLVSVLSKTLSMPSRMLVSLLYIFMMYGLLVAYISIGGDLIRSILPVQISSYILTYPAIVIGFTLLFGVVIFHEMHILDQYNSYLVYGLLLIFLIMLITAAPHITAANLSYRNFNGLYTMLPLGMLCFGYPTIIPSLRQYCGHDKTRIVRVIVIGGFVSMLMYILWQLAVLGSLPVSGSQGFVLPEQNVSSLNAALYQVTQSQFLPLCLGIFAFLAVVTSFMSVAKVLVDFFTDGLFITGLKNHKRSAQICTLIPPLLVSLYIPGLFVYAIMFSGAIMGFLLIYLPAFVVWRGRYHKNLSQEYVCEGGKPLLIFMMMMGVIVAAIEIISKII